MGVTAKEEAMKLTVPKLKEELGSRGLSQDGLKAVLLERLLTDIQRVDAETEEAAKAAEKEKAEEAARAAEEAKAEEAAKAADDAKAEEAVKAAEEAKADEEAAKAAEEAKADEEAAKAAEEAKAEEAAKAAEEAKVEEAAKAAEEAKAEGAAKAEEEAKAAEAAKAEEEAKAAEAAKAAEEAKTAEEAKAAEAMKAKEDIKAEETAKAAEEPKAEEAAKTDEIEQAQEAAEVPEEAKDQEDAGEDNKTDVKEDAEAQDLKIKDEPVPKEETDEPVTANGGGGAEVPAQATEEKAQEPKTEADMEESGVSTEKDGASPADGDVKPDPMETDAADAETTDATPKEEATETAKAEVDPDAVTDTPAVDGEGGTKDGDGDGEADGEKGGGEGKDGPGSPASVGDEPPSKKAKTSNGAATKKAKLTGDPSGREIFIDNIPESATDDEVKKLAEDKGGPVGSIRVIRSQPNLPKCKGLALVRFLDRDSAQKALEDIPKDKLGENELSARASSNANTLFIGNLNKLWTKEQVLKAFTEEVEGVVNFEVTMDALNRNHNRGFGFATFDTVESCKAAHAKYYKDKLKIMDNPVLIDWAETRGNKEDDERGVYILNVDENVEDEAFKANFAKFGIIEKIVYGRLIPHARRKDFAIINFSTRQAAKACIQEMNGTKFMGKELEITMAKAKRKRDFIPYQERFTTGGRVGGPRNFGAGGGGPQGRAPMYSGGYGGRGSGRGGVMYPRPQGGRGFVGGPGIPVAGVPGVPAVPGVPGVPAGGFGGPYMAGGAAGRGGYVQPQYQAYQPSGQTYIAGGQAVYQPTPMVYAPAQAYPQPYGAQPVVPQPYLAGGSNSAAPQPWQPPRQF